MLLRPHELKVRLSEKTQVLPVLCWQPFRGLLFGVAVILYPWER
jgi:hypothetical protein